MKFKEYILNESKEELLALHKDLVKLIMKKGESFPKKHGAWFLLDMKDGNFFQ